MNPRTLALTAAAMVAFAANSVLCRLALGAGLIDAASFATVRTVAGAVVLYCLWQVEYVEPIESPTGQPSPSGVCFVVDGRPCRDVL